MLLSYIMTFLGYSCCYLFAKRNKIKDRGNFVEKANSIYFGSIFFLCSLTGITYYNTSDDYNYKTTIMSNFLLELMLIRSFVDLYYIYNYNSKVDFYIHHFLCIIFSSYLYSKEKYHYYFMLMCLCEISTLFSSLTFTLKNYYNNRNMVIISGIFLWVSYFFTRIILFPYEMYVFNKNLPPNYTILEFVFINLGFISGFIISYVWFVKITKGIYIKLFEHLNINI